MPLQPVPSTIPGAGKSAQGVPALGSPAANRHQVLSRQLGAHSQRWPAAEQVSLPAYRTSLQDELTPYRLEVPAQKAVADSAHVTVAIECPSLHDAPAIGVTRLPSAQAVANKLGLQLLAALMSDPGAKACAAVLSPTSVASMLSLLFGGAVGQQSSAFLRAFGVSHASDVDHLSEVWREERHGVGKKDTVLTGASALFGSQSLKLLRPFKQHIAAQKAAAFCDYEKLEDACTDINRWAAKNTYGMVNQVVGPQSLTEGALLLIDAVAFKARWALPFSPDRTLLRQPFFDATQQAARGQVDLMVQQDTWLDYFACGEYCAVKLPYAGREAGTDFNLLACLPDKGQDVPALLQLFLANGLPGAELFRRCKLDLLALPKWTTKATLSLGTHLQKLGFPVEEAFYGIDKRNFCRVSAIEQQAKIEVDEQGTRAAAVTACMLQLGCAWPPPPELNVIFNRPFLYAIVDPQGLAHFLGVFSLASV